IDRFSPGRCGSSRGRVVTVGRIVSIDAAARRWEKGRPGPRRRGPDPPGRPRAPPMHWRDIAGKWLIGFHADALVRLAGIRRIASWKAVQAEPVEPRRLPDGLIEIDLRGRSDPILVALEISTYAYTRLAKQAADDALLIYLARGVVPEVVTLILLPRGRRSAPRVRHPQPGGDDGHPRR